MTNNSAQHTFLNEHGRLIGITVEDSADGVKITISSPDTLIEHTFTLNEIYGLYEVLGDYLSQHQPNTPGN